MSAAVGVRVVPAPRPSPEDPPDVDERAPVGSRRVVGTAAGHRAGAEAGDADGDDHGPGSDLGTGRGPGTEGGAATGDGAGARTAAGHGSCTGPAGGTSTRSGAGARGPTVERLVPPRGTVYSHAPPGPTDRPTSAPPPPPGGVAGTLDVRQACCLVALAAVEVLAGIRPLAQLARWVTPDVYDALARRAALTVPRGPHLDPVADRGALPVGGTRPSVRRVRVCPVDPAVVESSVVVAHAGRVRAVAVRLTRASGRWRASALVVG